MFSEEEETLVVGIALPMLPDVAPDEDHELRHFTRAEAEALELAGRPVRVEHDKKACWAVGRVVTSAMRDDSPHKRVLLALRGDTDEGKMAVDQVMTRGYRDLSLQHKVGYTICASSAGEHRGYYVKTPDEVTLTERGWRDYSRIEHVFPCRADLERATDADLRTFVDAFNHRGTMGAPATIGARGSAQRAAYISALSSAVATRRTSVLAATRLDRAERLEPLAAYPHRIVAPLATVSASMTDAPMPDAPAAAAPPPAQSPAAASLPPPPPQTPTTLPVAGTAPAVPAATIAPLTAEQMRDTRAVLAKLEAAEKSRNEALDAGLKMAERLRELEEKEKKALAAAAEEAEKAKAVVRERLARNTSDEVIDKYVAAGVIPAAHAATLKRDRDASLVSDPIGLELRVMPLIDVAASALAKSEASEQASRELAVSRMAAADRDWHFGQVQEHLHRVEAGNVKQAELDRAMAGMKRPFAERFSEAADPIIVSASAAAAVDKRPRLAEPAPAAKSILTPVGQSAAAATAASAAAAAAPLTLREMAARMQAKAGRMPTAWELRHANAMTGQIVVSASAEGRHMAFEPDYGRLNSVPPLAITLDTWSSAAYKTLMTEPTFAAVRKVSVPPQDMRAPHLRMARGPPGNPYGALPQGMVAPPL